MASTIVSPSKDIPIRKDEPTDEKWATKRKLKKDTNFESNNKQKRKDDLETGKSLQRPEKQNGKKTPHPEQQQKSKRQRYSRNGCLACKKRKVKCDEGLPSCGRCTKLNADCVYYRVFRYQASSTRVNTAEVDQYEQPKTLNKPESNNDNIHAGIDTVLLPRASVSETVEGDTAQDNRNESTNSLLGHGLNDNDNQLFTEGLTSLLTNQELLFGDIVGLSDNLFNFEGNLSENIQSLLPDYDITNHQSNHLNTTANSNNIFNNVSLTQASNPTSLDSTIKSTSFPRTRNRTDVSTSVSDTVTAESSESNSHVSTNTPSNENTSTSLNYPPPKLGNTNHNRMANEAFRHPYALPHTSIAESQSHVLGYDYLFNLNKSSSEVEINSIADSLKINFSESIHLQSFVKNVHLVLYPLATSYLKSPFIEAFLEEARTSNYLLNAMLASGARFLCEKSKIDRDAHLLQYRNKVDRGYLDSLENQIELNDKYRVHYLSNCFQSLKLIQEDLDNLTGNVESALLTSLLLTADLSSNQDDKWTLHLRGAKQFLSKLKVSDDTCSAPLILSRYLFSSLEISSGMAAVSGSCLDLEEIESWLPIPLNHGPLKTLCKMGLVVDGMVGDEYNIGGFKTYLGFSDHVTELIKEIVSAKKKDVVDAFSLCKIFSLIDKAKDFHIITKTLPFIIPLDSKYHPLYEGADKSKLSLAGYYHMSSNKMRAFIPGFTNLGTGTEDESPDSSYWISFFDFIQQMRVNSLYLYVLTSSRMLNCPVDNPMVQKLLKSCIESCFFMIQLNYNDLTDSDLEFLQSHYSTDIVLDSTHTEGIDFNKGKKYFEITDEALENIYRSTTKSQSALDFAQYLNFDVDHRICMFQWCLLIFGYCCIDATDKVIVECLLTKLLFVGIKSASSSIDKVKRVWTQRRLCFRDINDRVTRLNPTYEEKFFTESESNFPFT